MRDESGSDRPPKLGHVRKVGPDARLRPPDDAPSSRAIGRTAAALRDALTKGRQVEIGELGALADRLAICLPLAARDRDQLTRVLGVPPALALRWVQDTIGLLRRPDAAPDGRQLDIARLDVLAWAWGDIPPGWEASMEQKVLRRWTAELSHAQHLGGVHEPPTASP